MRVKSYQITITSKLLGNVSATVRELEISRMSVIDNDYSTFTLRYRRGRN